jgi:hypothetical protein
MAGQDGCVPSTVDLPNLDGINDFAIPGRNEAGRSGYSVSRRRT